MSAHEHWDITVDTPVGQQRGSLELRVTRGGLHRASLQRSW